MFKWDERSFLPKPEDDLKENSCDSVAQRQGQAQNLCPSLVISLAKALMIYQVRFAFIKIQKASDSATFANPDPSDLNTVISKFCS